MNGPLIMLIVVVMLSIVLIVKSIVDDCTKRKAMKLIASVDADLDLAGTSNSIRLFMLFYDSALEKLQKLQAMEKTAARYMKATPSLTIKRLQEEFQWHLCDAIVRTKETALNEITQKYKNVKEFQRKCAYDFYDSIRDSKDRFSKDSLELADESLREVFRVAKTDYYGSLIEKEESYQGEDEEQKFDDLVELEFGKIDFMEGHEFEYWCADLLIKNGFINVEVTPGSGDQGVDVVAEKDGIRYAIQCKCYSSDLGNKPVQEVHAGKAFYQCHVGVVMTNQHFTSGAIQLSKSTGVLLWDREKLKEMLETPLI